MGTLRHLILFGTFGVAGLGLALGIGLSSDPSPDVNLGQPTSETTPRSPRGTEASISRVRSDDRSLPPDPDALATLRTPRSSWAVATNPATVRPYPPYAHQVLPDSPAVRRLQAALDFQERQGNGAGAVPTPPIPSSPPTSAASAAGAAPQDAEPANREPPLAPAGPTTVVKPAAEPALHGEGDGRLVINIQETDIRKVLEMLSEQGNLNILASKSVQGNVSATLNGVDLDSALEAILKSTGYVARREGQFLFVGTPADFDQMEHSMDRIGTRVYHPNYVKASDLKDLIQPLLTEQIGVVSVTAPAEVGIGADDSQVGGDNFAGTEALLVRDYEAVLDEIDQVVEEIDIRPMQVHIEAMILSVKLNDNNKLGVNFQNIFKDGAANFAVGWGLPIDNLNSMAFDDGAFKYAFLDGDVSWFINALEHIGDTNVIATPRLMVLNKHRADIQIGRQEGYISTTSATETSTTQSVEFLDLGTQLRLRPFITPDGLIRMEVHPELSDGAVEIKGGFTLPNKDVTQVTTNVMVRDGCTVIIGGLMQEQLATTTDQIPFFGNLPLVGMLFRNKEEKISRREIIVLLTPHIVYEPDTCNEGETAAGEFFRRQDVYREKMSPIGKRSVGRRYFRMAQRAWAAGEQRRALRFAEMAVHFDPLNRAAIDLRSDIWLGNASGDHTLGGPATALPATVTAGPLDGDAIAPWLLNDLESPPARPRMPLHPLDPGQPGVHKDIEPSRKLP